jgi:hypothetical protein
MSGATPPLPQYVFMAWCSVKKEHRDNFTFTFTLDGWTTNEILRPHSNYKYYVTSNNEYKDGYEYSIKNNLNWHGPFYPHAKWSLCSLHTTWSLSDSSMTWPIDQPQVTLTWNGNHVTLIWHDLQVAITLHDLKWPTHYLTSVYPQMAWLWSGPYLT